MLLLRLFFFVNLILLLAAASETSLLQALFIVLSKLVVVKSVGALCLSAEAALVLRQVVAPDEETNDSVEQGVDEYDRDDDEPPVWYDLLVVRLDADFSESFLGDH